MSRCAKEPFSTIPGWAGQFPCSGLRSAVWLTLRQGRQVVLSMWDVWCHWSRLKIFSGGICQVYESLLYWLAHLNAFGTWGDLQVDEACVGPPGTKVLFWLTGVGVLAAKVQSTIDEDVSYNFAWFCYVRTLLQHVKAPMPQQTAPWQLDYVNVRCQHFCLPPPPPHFFFFGLCESATNIDKFVYICSMNSWMLLSVVSQGSGYKCAIWQCGFCCH